MLDDSRIEVLKFFLLSVPFDISVFHDKTFMSSYFTFFIRQRDTSLFRKNAVGRDCSDIWIDHNSFVYDDVLALFFSPLGGSNYPDILTNLGSCKSDSFVFVHQSYEVSCKVHELFIYFFDFVRNSP